MVESQSCGELVAGAVSRGYSVLKGDELAVLFAFFAAVRTAVRYCWRSKYPEAHELASVLILGVLFAACLAATELEVPVLVKQVMSCNTHKKVQSSTALRGGIEWCSLWRGRIATAGQLDLATAAGG
jgi:hypothetical protein